MTVSSDCIFRLEGPGSIQYANGDKFEGTFVRHKRVGTGKIEYSDGRIYSGQFENDEINGLGTMTYPSGASLTGEWLDGKISKWGTFEGDLSLIGCENVIRESSKEDSTKGDESSKPTVTGKYTGEW